MNGKGVPAGGRAPHSAWEEEVAAIDDALSTAGADADVVAVECPYIVVCAWCQKVLYTPEDPISAEISHGICSECAAKQRAAAAGLCGCGLPNGHAGEHAAHEDGTPL